MKLHTLYDTCYTLQHDFDNAIIVELFNDYLYLLTESNFLLEVDIVSGMFRSVRYNVTDCDEAKEIIKELRK